jgi:hypothetical protein
MEESFCAANAAQIFQSLSLETITPLPQQHF